MNKSLLFVALLIAAAPGHVVGDVPAEPAAAAPAVCVPDLCGTWSGQWCSRSNGHQGPMQATFCRIDCHRYEVTFRGRFCRLIPFRYKAVLCASHGDDGCVHLLGSKRLGPIFGTFHFRGSASPTRFVATYWSDKDHGTFTMSRCCR